MHVKPNIRPQNSPRGGKIRKIASVNKKRSGEVLFAWAESYYEVIEHAL